MGASSYRPYRPKAHEIPFKIKIRSVCSLLVGSNHAVSDMAIVDKGAVDLVRKLSGEARCTASLVGRVAILEEEEPGELVIYNIANTTHYTQGKMTSLVCLKKSQVIMGKNSIVSLLKMMLIYCYVLTATAPCFKNFVREGGKADRDGDKMATSKEKKINELEMSLLLLQQNIDIPEISLVVHPTVAQIIKRCCDHVVYAKVADFSDRNVDFTFLNTLQNQVL